MIQYAIKVKKIENWYYRGKGNYSAKPKLYSSKAVATNTMKYSVQDCEVVAFECNPVIKEDKLTIHDPFK